MNMKADIPALERLEIVDTNLPELEYSSLPTEGVMEKQKGIFPNAQLCFFGYELM
jgi:hypothetical protein